MLECSETEKVTTHSCFGKFRVFPVGITDDKRREEM